MQNQVSRVMPKSIRSLIQELVATPQIASFYEWGNRARARAPRAHMPVRFMRGKVVERRME